MKAKVRFKGRNMVVITIDTSIVVLTRAQCRAVLQSEPRARRRRARQAWHQAAEVISLEQLRSAERRRGRSPCTQPSLVSSC
jgi:hypothetical protein